jgi:hypothetical protein
MPDSYNSNDSGTDPRASARPSRGDERASARPPDDADVGTVGDEPGLLERVGSAASELGSRAADAAGDALEPNDDNSGGSLFEMGDGRDQRGSSGFGQLGEDRDRSSPLFNMGADSGGDSGPSAFDRLGEDRDRGSSSLFDMGDDSGGGSGPSAFDRLGDDDDTTAQERLNRLSEADDSEDVYG